MRKITPPDSNHLYAMKVLKKATLKGRRVLLQCSYPPCPKEHWGNVTAATAGDLSEREVSLPQPNSLLFSPNIKNPRCSAGGGKDLAQAAGY